MKSKFHIEDTAILLIDHQQGTIKISGSQPAASIIRNTRALARLAVDCGMPLILTSSMEDHFQGPLLDDLNDIAPKAFEARIKRPGIVDCWEYAPYREAVLATGKQNLVMAGLTNDVCIVYPSISAVEEGFNVQVVVDAGGSPTQIADETSFRRMERHGVGLTSTNQLMAELAYTWSEGYGERIIAIMYEEILRFHVEA